MNKSVLTLVVLFFAVLLLVLTQAELGQAIGYSAPVVGNIKQGSRNLGLKTLGDLFAALGGELYTEYRQK